MIKIASAGNIEVSDHDDGGISGLSAHRFCQLLQLLFFHSGIHPMPFPITCKIGKQMGIYNNHGNVVPCEPCDQHSFEKQPIQQHRCIPKPSIYIRFKNVVCDGNAGEGQQATLWTMNIGLTPCVGITCTCLYQQISISVKLDFLQANNLIGILFQLFCQCEQPAPGIWQHKPKAVQSEQRKRIGHFGIETGITTLL